MLIIRALALQLNLYACLGLLRPTLSQSDVGYFIRGTASYTDGYGTDESVSVVSETAVLSLNDEPVITGPLFSGTLREAETLI